MKFRKKNMFLLSVILIMTMAVTLSACGKDKSASGQSGAESATTVSPVTTSEATTEPSPTPESAQSPLPTPESTATPEPVSEPKPTPSVIPESKPIPSSAPEPVSTPTTKSDKGVSLLDKSNSELWHMAASYGSYDLKEGYAFAGEKFNKAIVIEYSVDSIFPSGEVYMVIYNKDKQYKTLTFDAWVESVSTEFNSGLGLFNISVEGEYGHEEILDMSTIPTGQVKNFKADISDYEEIWIYTGLNPGSKVGFANVVIK